MFGLMTKAEHERLMAGQKQRLEADVAGYRNIALAQAREIDALTPLAKVGKARLEALERAKQKGRK